MLADLGYAIVFLSGFWIPVAAISFLGAFSLLPYPEVRVVVHRTRRWVARMGVVFLSLAAVSVVIAAPLSLGVAVFVILLPALSLLALSHAVLSGWKLGELVLTGTKVGEWMWTLSVAVLGVGVAGCLVGMIWPPAWAIVVPVLGIALAGGLLLVPDVPLGLVATGSVLLLVVVAWNSVTMDVPFALRGTVPIPVLILLGVLPWTRRTDLWTRWDVVPQEADPQPNDSDPKKDRD